MNHRLLPAVLALSLPPALAPAADWPQWRGPNRDGTAPGARLPAKWPAEAPAPKWKAYVGAGYGGAAAAGGKVFIMGRRPVAVAGYDFGVERCLCLDADTGKEVWKVEYVQPFRPPDPSAGYGPNSTPTVDRDRVYMLGLGGMFHCVEVATGKVLWKHDCKAEYWGQKVSQPLGDDAWFPPCGCATAPLVDGDTVIVSVGGKKAGSVAGFDRATGKIVWKALDDRSSYASPVVASFGGAKQVVAMTGTRMVGIGGADHKVLWEAPYKAYLEQTIITPLVWKDLVIHGGDGRPTYALRVTESGGKWGTEQAWKSDDLKEYMTTPVAFGGHLIGYDTRTSSLVCLSLETGEKAWSSPRIAGKHFSLVVAGDVVLVLNSEGELRAVKASPTEYVELAKWKVSGPGSWAHLAVAGNRLYVKDKDTLYCYEL